MDSCWNCYNHLQYECGGRGSPAHDYKKVCWLPEYDRLMKEFKITQKALELAIDHLDDHNFFCTLPNWEERCFKYDGDCNKCAMEFYIAEAKKVVENG